MQLSARTATLGFPVSRSAISKIESNSRAGKLELAEVCVLAIALETAVALLMFPDLVTGMVQPTPAMHPIGSGVAALAFLGERDIDAHIRFDLGEEAFPGLSPSGEVRNEKLLLLREWAAGQAMNSDIERQRNSLIDRAVRQGEDVSASEWEAFEQSRRTAWLAQHNVFLRRRAAGMQIPDGAVERSEQLAAGERKGWYDPKSVTDTDS